MMETMLSQVTSLLVEALNGSGNQSTVLAGESARLISLVDVASLSSNNDHVTNTLSDASEPTLIDLRLETPARINRIKGGNHQHRHNPCLNESKRPYKVDELQIITAMLHSFATQLIATHYPVYWYLSMSERHCFSMSK